MNKRFSSLMIVAIFVFIFASTANAEYFFAYLEGRQENPGVATTATGYARVFLDPTAGTITYRVVYNGLSSAQTAGHIHTGARGTNGPVTIGFAVVGGTSGVLNGSSPITAAQITTLRSQGMYVNVHTTNNAGGEIRGQLAAKRPIDFDGDGKNDFSVLRFPAVASPGVAQIQYWNRNSTSGTVISTAWGDANRDFPCPGDFDGDGQDDYSLYRDSATLGGQSEFWVLTSGTSTVLYYAWGLGQPSTTNFNPSDTPLCRDYDGDGKTDVAVARRGANTGDPLTWYIRQSSTNTSRVVNWGVTGSATNAFYDAPIPADYDGDGKADLAIYRFGTAPDNSYVIQRSSDGGTTFQQWGSFATDYILPGDYDGDGKADYAVARTGATATTPMVWWILQSSNGQIVTRQFGLTNDLPTQGDYDGDGRTDISIFRQGASTGAAANFWVLNSFDNTIQTTQWGIAPNFAVNTFDIR